LIRDDFEGGWAGETETRTAIADTWRRYRYLADPHTAVALHVQGKRGGTGRPAVVVSTANPYKFAGDVLEALTGKKAPDSPFAQCDALLAETGVAPPPAISALRELPILHRQSVSPSHMGDALVRMLEALDAPRDGKPA
jgi:threonine synthase